MKTAVGELRFSFWTQITCEIFEIPIFIFKNYSKKLHFLKSVL